MEKTYIYAVANYSGNNRHIAGIYTEEEEAIKHAKTEAKRVVRFMNDNPNVWRREKDERHKLQSNSTYTVIQYQVLLIQKGYMSTITEVVKIELKDKFTKLRPGSDFV